MDSTPSNPFTSSSSSELSRLELAEAVRQACIKAAAEGFQDASIQGLCQEGAVEAAISAIEMMDLKALIVDRG
ncbi:MAG: acetyltransferase [Balneolaceae bacterium]